MRAMFGLVALLVTVAIILLVWRAYVPTTLQKGKEAEQQVKPMTINPGVMNDGSPPPAGGATGPGGNRITLSGDPKGLTVTDIGPVNAMAEHYLLQKGDLILRAGDTDLRSLSESDARIFLQQAYTYQRELIVERNGERVTLEFKK